MKKDYPFEMIKLSDLAESTEKETKTPVIFLDRKTNRKISAGEETDLADIAKDEGVSTYVESPTEIPGGTSHIHCPTLSGTELAQAIIRDFGQFCAGGRVFLSDGFYFLYPDNEVKKCLSEDLTDLQMWINTYFDCDDFSQVVAGAVNNTLKGVPFGTLWFKGPGFYHAVNCYYSKNEKKMKVVEPQNDAIYDFNKSAWCPMLVVM